MKIKFWGVRGSIPVPGPGTIKYGGNTTCIEIRTKSGDIIILDGGSGIRGLGLSLLAGLPVNPSIFITHTHWDHIQGLPFFAPFFIPGNKVSIYGAFDPVYKKDLAAILSGQMEYCYFPVRANELKAEITYQNLKESDSVTIGSAEVSCILANHPIMNLAYKVKEGDKEFFFTGDHEPLQNIYTPGEEEYAEYQELIDMRTQRMVDFIRGAQVMVADSQYTPEEYKTKVGWGHGSYLSCIDLAARAGVKKLYLTHHEPTRSDAALDKILEEIRLLPDLPSGLEIELAQEGLEFEV